MRGDAITASGGGARPGPDDSLRSTIPRRSGATAVAAFALLLLVLGFAVTREDLLFGGAVALTYALAATGLGLALGLGGEYLLGQGFIFAVGGYVSAILTTEEYGWGFWPSVAGGTAIALAVGLALSLVGLRISKFYFAMVGFFLVFLIPSIVQIFEERTGGATGLAVPVMPSFGGEVLDPQGVFFLCAAALVLGLLATHNLRSSPMGMLMRRMRDNPVAAATNGVAPWRVRLSIYAFAAVLAGLGGAIFGHLNGYIAPEDFGLNVTILLFAAVIVGGKTALIGPTLGVLVLYVVPNIILDVQGYNDLIYGGIVLVAVIAFREGLVQGLAAVARQLQRRARPGIASDRSPATAVASADLARRLAEIRGRVDHGATLVAHAVRKRFGGVRALDLDDDQGVVVEPGQIHLLLGPNGSGKTTLLNVMTGLVTPDHGTIRFGTEDITASKPAKRARLGISRSFQGPVLPPEVTPLDLIGARLGHLRRLSYAHWLLGSPWAVRARREDRRRAMELLVAAGLGRAATEPCAGLSSGQRRILDVLQALVSPAGVVLLDEPAAGLSEPEREQLASTLVDLAATGTGFVVVEHDLTLAMRIAAQVTVLASGRVIAQGTPAEVQADPEVRRVLMGEVEWTASSSTG